MGEENMRGACATYVAMLDEPPPRYCEAAGRSTSGTRAPTKLRTVGMLPGWEAFRR
jgi:hypothetical protein